MQSVQWGQHSNPKEHATKSKETNGYHGSKVPNQTPAPESTGPKESRMNVEIITLLYVANCKSKEKGEEWEEAHNLHTDSELSS